MINGLFWFLIGGFIFLCGMLFLLHKKEKDANKKTRKNKIFYIPLGAVTSIVLTPFFAYIFTLNVSNFEGARGFALLYMTPIVFIGLLLTWFILHRIFAKKKKFYSTVNTIFSIISLVLVLLYFGVYLKDRQETKDLKRNSYRCKQKIKESYNGIVVDTSRGNIKIRKIDTTYKEFKYTFSNVKLIKKHFYIGQKITKKAGEEKFEVILKNGKAKEFTIPCYQ